MMYMYRKGKLHAKSIRPTLKNIIFFRSALGRAASLQPLIRAQDNADFEPMPPSLEGAAACEVAQAPILLQSHQIEAMLRVNADLHAKQLEQDRKMKEQADAIQLLQKSVSSK
jgi:hypothetical protein